MTELWFAIASVMLAIYVVMDGFDFGAGALHLFVAKTDAERRQVLAAIGPYWDGNEVWLLALGGVLFVAFPTVLASGLSGFYFAIFLVLWSFILRGIAIEFRSHLEAGTWRAAWDFVFAAASIALPILFGAALGNLLRGLPLDQSGWFSLALFTDFSARDPVGILDWYTVSVGVFALVALVAHGALFLAWKTDGPVHVRTHMVALWLYAAAALLLPLLSVGTNVGAPGLLRCGRRTPTRDARGAGRGRGYGERIRRPSPASPPARVHRLRRVPGGAAGVDSRGCLSGDAARHRRRGAVAHGLQCERDRLEPARGNPLVARGDPARRNLLRDRVPDSPWESGGSRGAGGVLTHGCWMQDAGCRMSDVGCTDGG